VDAPTQTSDRAANLRETAVPILAAIVAASWYAAVTPATVRTGADLVAIFEAMDTGPIVVPMVATVLTALLIASWGSRAVIERRLPWPFGPRRRGRNPYWRETTAALTAGFVVQLASNYGSEWSKLHELDDGRFLWVGLPAGLAAKWVAWLAAFGLTYVLVHLIVGRWIQWRRRSPGALLEHGTAPQG
jgi:hypothetical protein